MGGCLMLHVVPILGGTWLEWFANPANWWVVLQVAGGLGFVIFVTVFTVPTFLLANVPLAEALDSVTVSPEITPDKAAEPLFSVAVVVPS